MKKGQIALIVLIISAIVMTVGLSLSRKSVVETKITTDEELLKQAFNAAESGVDYYLGTGKVGFTSPDGQSMARVTVNNIGGGQQIVNLGGTTLRNNNNFIWLMGHKADGSLDPTINMNGMSGLTVCVDNAFNGSLKVEYFYLNAAVYSVYRTGFNIGTAGRVSGYADITGGSCLVSGMKSVFLGSMSAGTPLLLVVKPIADDTKIVVSTTGANFPSQGVEISSIGTAGNVTGVGSSGAMVNREVNVINQYIIPSFMLDAITAAGNVLSN
jgi:hypothetical protein